METLRCAARFLHAQRQKDLQTPVRMDGEANGMGGNGEIDSLYERRILTNFISMWKPFLDILQQNEKKEN